jgi:hypothetical protein
MQSKRAGSLPNFIVAGAPKAGTSSLHKWLCDHPQTIGSDPKETYYFVDRDSHTAGASHFENKGIDGYRKLFENPHSTTQIIFESTPGYLYSNLALKQIPELESKPRVLFLLREPAGQLFSLYRYFQQNWNWIPETMDFPTFIAASRTGSHTFGGNTLAQNAYKNASYINFLLPWLNRLNHSRMRVLLFEDMIRDPLQFMTGLGDWLELDSSFYHTYAFNPENQTYRVKSFVLQQLNLMIRPLIPQSDYYRKLRSLYRSINTTQPRPPTLSEKQTLVGLRQDFHKSNQQLASTFCLNLDPWTIPHKS